MNFALRTLIAFGLFAALFAQPVSAQQVKFTVKEVKTGEKIKLGKQSTELVYENYTVSVPYTSQKIETYEVEIPYVTIVDETYEVEVPYTEFVPGDDGKLEEVKKNAYRKKNTLGANPKN